jgi:hypothetical protein
MRGNAFHDPLGSLREDARLAVAKEQRADHVPGARNERNGEIAAHRSNAVLRPVSDNRPGVDGVLSNVVETENTAVIQQRPDHAVFARKRQSFERLPVYFGKRIELEVIVVGRYPAGKERAELSAGQFDAAVGDGLQQRRHLQLGIELGSCAVQHAEHPLLLEQRELGTLLIGHVGKDRDVAEQLPVVIADRRISHLR